jgi:Na+-driven multidrug efflux pump
MDRVKSVILNGVLVVVIFQFSVGALFALLSPFLCGIIASSKEVVELATVRLTIMGLFYFMCGIMEVLGNGGVRTMGKPVISMVVSICGAAIFRSIFLEVTFYFIPEFSTIFLSYLASWTLTSLIYVFIVPKVYKGLKKKLSSN